jgi:ADP-ribose pyrophosphatase
MTKVFQGNYIEVTVEDSIEKVFLRHSVHTFLVTDQGKIRVTVEKKLGSDETKEKIQGGVLDDGENPLECAKRELLEELGCEAGDWKLFDVQEQSGTVNDTRHYFIASNLVMMSDNTDGEVLQTADYTIDELYEKSMTGTFSPFTRAAIAKLHYQVTKNIICL